MAEINYRFVSPLTFLFGAVELSYLITFLYWWKLETFWNGKYSATSLTGILGSSYIIQFPRGHLLTLYCILSIAFTFAMVLLSAVWTGFFLATDSKSNKTRWAPFLMFLFTIISIAIAATLIYHAHSQLMEKHQLNSPTFLSDNDLLYGSTLRMMSDERPVRHLSTGDPGNVGQVRLLTDMEQAQHTVTSSPRTVAPLTVAQNKSTTTQSDELEIDLQIGYQSFTANHTSQMFKIRVDSLHVERWVFESCGNIQRKEYTLTCALNETRVCINYISSWCNMNHNRLIGTLIFTSIVLFERFLYSLLFFVITYILCLEEEEEDAHSDLSNRGIIPIPIVPQRTEFIQRTKSIPYQGYPVPMTYPVPNYMI